MCSKVRVHLRVYMCILSGIDNIYIRAVKQLLRV